MKPSFFTSLWKLLAVGGIFYSSYGFSNWLTDQRMPVPEMTFSWESSIPFLPWTILPYWSLNGFYALAFFSCRSGREQHRLIAQLLLAQAIAIAGFLCFPLQFSWAKPATDGFSGQLFASLQAFDQPYNQAPSLHIILTLIIGRFYWYRLPARWRGVWAGWFFLIAVSVLTTWQHHFIDIPSGVVVGLLILWALPWQKNTPASSPLKSHISLTSRHRKVAILYGSAATLFVILSLPGGAYLWFLWPAISCALMTLAYAHYGSAVLQKQANGWPSFPAAFLLAPQHLGAALNRRVWLRKIPLSQEIIPGKIHLGSIAALSDFPAALDLCAELPAHGRPTQYHSLPMLDMVAPDAETLRNGAEILQKMLEQQTPVLVCCALGYGRSVAVILTWMLRYDHAQTLDKAFARIQPIRPGIVLPEDTRNAITLATMESS